MKAAALHKKLVAAAEAVGHAEANFAAECRIAEGVLIGLVEEVGGAEISGDAMGELVRGGEVETA